MHGFPQESVVRLPVQCVEDTIRHPSEYRPGIFITQYTEFTNFQQRPQGRRSHCSQDAIIEEVCRFFPRHSSGKSIQCRHCLSSREHPLLENYTSIIGITQGPSLGSVTPLASVDWCTRRRKRNQFSGVM